MEKHWIKTFKMWGKQEEYKKRINEAEKIITKALNISNNPYVSFSGGKDSTVLLSMVLKQKNDVLVWHWDYGDHLMPRYLEKEVQKNMIELGVKNSVTQKRKGNNARENHSSGYKQFFGNLEILKKNRSLDLAFIGVRQEESITRKNSYTKFFMGDNCYPLLKLTWMDVWAYIIRNNLPYVGIYDKYSKVLGYDKSRFVTFFDKEMESKGGYYFDGVIVPEFRHIKISEKED